MRSYEPKSYTWDQIVDIRKQADYQQFELDTDGMPHATGERTKLKVRATLPLLDVRGKTVLDVGCDFGFWSFLAASMGATEVVGIDRNRTERGIGYVDLIELNRVTAAHYPTLAGCKFIYQDVGKQWFERGRFDIVLAMSMFHHVLQNMGGDYASVWYWLRRHVKDDGLLVWEGAVTAKDRSLQLNLDRQVLDQYDIGRLASTAERYFRITARFPALHEPTREVWLMKPKRPKATYCAVGFCDGAGGATRAFEWKDSRRIVEIEESIGFRPYPGSLNAIMQSPFDWNAGYYRSQILDPRNRRQLDWDWYPRWARFYPVILSDSRQSVWGFRFEGESYPENFLELIAAERLRDHLISQNVGLLCYDEWPRSNT